MRHSSPQRARQGKGCRGRLTSAQRRACHRAPQPSRGRMRSRSSHCCPRHAPERPPPVSRCRALCSPPAAGYTLRACQWHVVWLFEHMQANTCMKACWLCMHDFAVALLIRKHALEHALDAGQEHTARMTIWSLATVAFVTICRPQDSTFVRAPRSAISGEHW